MLRASSDERLVARVRRGDERAFEAIYDRHHRALLAFCRHMLGTREEAEDALQHVFVSAHRHLRGHDRPVQLKPWLYAIARNRCVSMLRARRETVPLESVAAPSTDGLAVAAEVERREELRDTLADLARLPDEQRAALVLAELGDLSHAEIAEALEVRTDKVKALVFQAREALAGRREARLADCREIRRQLATLRGSALRRGPLARHVAVCPACAEFKAEVARQRTAFALVLPVVPSLALKDGVLSAVVGTGGGAAAATGAVVAGSGAAASSGFAAKALAVVVVGAGAGGGGAVAIRELDAPVPRAAAVAPVTTTAAKSAATATPVGEAPHARGGRGATTAAGRSRAQRRAGGKANADAKRRGAAPPRARAHRTEAARRPTAHPGQGDLGRSRRPATPPAKAPRAIGKANGPPPAAVEKPPGGPPANHPGKGALKRP
jgi:RNA polymerase sigma factor (sigma-70 family)